MRDRPVVSAPTDETAVLREAMLDIAKGRWNTPSRSLDTRGHLSAVQYAQAALRAARREARDDGRPSVGAGT